MDRECFWCGRTQHRSDRVGAGVIVLGKKDAGWRERIKKAFPQRLPDKDAGDAILETLFGSYYKGMENLFGPTNSNIAFRHGFLCETTPTGRYDPDFDRILTDAWEENLNR
jgi:hypothetical protein